MKKNIIFAVELCLFSLLFLIGGSLSTYAAPSDPIDKIPVKEFIARHLNSIGTEQARTAMKSVAIGGTSQAVFKGRGEGRADGIVVLASHEQRNMLGMKFNNPDYPHEKMGYDGKSFSVGFVRPGEYTVLGQFLRINERSFRSGIFGGTLSTAWELHNYDEGRGTLKHAGKTKIDGKELLKFNYRLKKGSDLNMALFFDPDNFRHVRTEYKRVISSGQGLTVDTSSRQNEIRYKMVEEFSDFREESNLTLPHGYNIYLEIISGRGTISYNWNMELSQFVFNQDLDANEFNFDSQ